MPDPLDPPQAGDFDLRRPPPGWRSRVEALADLTGVAPWRLLAGAGATALLLVAVLWALRPPPAPVEAELPFVSTTLAPPAGSPPSAPRALAGPPVVHVAGAVLAPGVHRLPVGARVIDAIEAAGGLAPDADESRVNLAAPVADGERVWVPRAGEGDPPAPVAGGAGGAAGQQAPGGGSRGEHPPPAIDINRATAEELDSLPGIGPATAAAIIEHRERVGPFTSVDQLLEVRGIGPAKLERLRPSVRV